ncbi:uncharacterized protein BXZ73DRAFT_52129, partial [Epithele typhae]|uniref:uncharacterized protein n=1 Tax=Epithele typhae TaxID=378194 RepID=UPI002007320D
MAHVGVVQRLGDDALLHILAFLAQKDIRSLSSTCTLMRGLCLPLVFKQCRLNCKDVLSDPPKIVPQSVWPYVSPLKLLHGDSAAEMVDDELRVARVLADSLSHMKKLESVRIHEGTQTSAQQDRPLGGVPLCVIATLLAIPQLRHIKVTGLLYNPTDSLIPSNTFGIASLESLTYISPRPRPKLQDPRAEDVLLEAMLVALHRTLVTLELPTYSAPFGVIQQLQWPSLQRLTLCGPHDPRVSLIDSLSHLHTLRLLHLFIAYSENAPPQPLLPSEKLEEFPWPLMEDFVLSSPLPEDGLWTRLPSELRRLHLRYWPHYRTISRRSRRRNGQEPWFSRLLDQTEVASIIRHAPRFAALRELELEYGINNHEEELSLLRAISTACPVLHSLTLMRY